MNVLVACEFSATVRDAFRQQGHFAISSDLIECEKGRDFHYQGDVRDILDGYKTEFGTVRWDLMIAHPPCTYLTVSGLHWNKRRPGRAAETDKALAFVRELLDAPIPRIALENPVGCISSAIRRPDQIIQPYNFGADASKRTCLWLKNLPPLEPTDQVAPRIVNGKKRWGNQTDSGQNKLAPSDTRWMERSRTYPGIAHAMAMQWGALAANEEFPDNELELAA